MSGGCELAAWAWAIGGAVGAGFGGLTGLIVGIVKGARRVPLPEAGHVRGVARRTNASD